jgi:hypothetical protein
MKHIKLFEAFNEAAHNGFRTKSETSKLNKLAYDGLKKIGHNFAIKPFDSNLNYMQEWNEAKRSPDLFDDFTEADRKKFGIDEKETSAYSAPKFAMRPAAGDTGYAYVAKQFGATPGPKKKKKNSRTQESE